MFQGELEKIRDPFDQALNQLYRGGPGSNGYGYAYQAVRGAHERGTPGFGESYWDRAAGGYGRNGEYVLQSLYTLVEAMTELIVCE